MPQKKAHQYVTKDYLMRRANYARSAGFPVPKFIEFSVWALEAGFRVFLHESHSTVSKYVYVENGSRRNQFKVRFSNHKPNREKEVLGDCDFFVGIAHHRTTTTEMAKEAVMKWAQAQAKEHA
jgi:hypothetical protein